MWLFKPLSTHTSAMSPALAIAPYGLCVARSRYRSIRALCRPISLSLHTGSSYGYCLRQYASAVALLPRRQYAQLARLCARACALARIRRSKLPPPLHTRPRVLPSCSMFCLSNGKWRSVGNEYSLLSMVQIDRNM